MHLSGSLACTTCWHPAMQCTVPMTSWSIGWPWSWLWWQLTASSAAHAAVTVCTRKTQNPPRIYGHKNQFRGIGRSFQDVLFLMRCVLFPQSEKQTWLFLTTSHFSEQSWHQHRAQIVFLLLCSQLPNPSLRKIDSPVVKKLHKNNAADDKVCICAEATDSSRTFCLLFCSWQSWHQPLLSSAHSEKEANRQWSKHVHRVSNLANEMGNLVKQIVEHGAKCRSL